MSKIFSCLPAGFPRPFPKPFPLAPQTVGPTLPLPTIQTKFSTDLAADNRKPDPKDVSKRLLWHGIDKIDWEIDLSKRQRHAKKLLVDHLVEKKGKDREAAESAVDAFDDNGAVIINSRKMGGNTGPVKVLEQDRSTHKLRIPTGTVAKVAALDLDFDFEAKLDEINDPPDARS